MINIWPYILSFFNSVWSFIKKILFWRKEALELEAVENKDSNVSKEVDQLNK